MPAGAAPPLAPAAALAPPPAGGSGDARASPVACDATGQRFRKFRDAALGHGCVDMLSNGGVPLGRHDRWSDCKLRPDDPGVDADEGGRRPLETPARYDQVNAPNIAAAGIAAREIQVAEERRRDKVAGSGDDRLDAHLARGTDLARGYFVPCQPRGADSWRTLQGMRRHEGT